MKEKDVLNFSCIELVSLFEREFPAIMQGASLSKDWKEFEQFLKGYVRAALTKYSTSSSIKRFFRMFMNETRHIRDFSTGEKIRYEPIKVMASFTGRGGWHTSWIFCWIGIIYLRNTRQMKSFYRSGCNVTNGGDVGKPGWMRM